MGAFVVVARGKSMPTSTTSLALSPPILVGDTIRRIEKASAEFLDFNGCVIHGNNQKVEAWGKEHKIKLPWNNWFDVSFTLLFRFLRLDSDRLA